MIGHEIKRPRARELKRMYDDIMDHFEWKTKGLRHPNVVNVYGLTFNERLRPYVIQESPEDSLEPYLEYTKVGWRDKLYLCLDIALGMEAIHGIGSVYGCLTADSVGMFETDGGRPK